MKKLVRDKIPEIIRAHGRIANIETANNDTEFYNMLNNKLKEEIDEFINATTNEEKIEEMADILEVIDAIIKYNTIDRNIIMAIKNKKFKERGGFDKRVILIKE